MYVEVTSDHLLTLTFLGSSSSAVLLRYIYSVYPFNPLVLRSSHILRISPLRTLPLLPLTLLFDRGSLEGWYSLHHSAYSYCFPQGPSMRFPIPWLAHSSNLKMEAPHTSETLAMIYQNTWHQISEDSNLFFGFMFLTGLITLFKNKFWRVLMIQ